MLHISWATSNTGTGSVIGQARIDSPAAQGVAGNLQDLRHA